VAVNAVADAEPSPLDPGDARELENADDGARLVVWDERARADAPVVREQLCEIDLAAEHAVADEEEVVIALARPPGEEEVVADSVDAVGVASARVLGNGLAETLGQVRVPTGPVEDAVEQHAPFRRLGGETARKRGGLVIAEVDELDSTPDVERSGARVADEVGRRCDAEQAERQALELWRLRASVEGLADAGEELVGGEGEAAHGVDLVDEHDHPAGHARKRDVDQCTQPALHRAEVAARAPESRELVVEIELLGRRDQQPLVPLLRRQILADLRQVEHDRGVAFRAESDGRAHHQRRLSHLARGENVAEAPVGHVAEELFVGASRHVARRIALERPSSNVESPTRRELAGDDRQGPSVRIARHLGVLRICRAISCFADTGSRRRRRDHSQVFGRCRSR
jgi:hypothetical protein